MRQCKELGKVEFRADFSLSRRDWPSAITTLLSHMIVYSHGSPLIHHPIISRCWVAVIRRFIRRVGIVRSVCNWCSMCERRESFVRVQHCENPYA
ncbi:UNVERIFIED_CONTAM: hypothetical protein Slati_3105800 [Sesamum latifolium]|uniref:Uncharacterized protein n=1 Tax=Sesamum latifolium TaxID=2727402 RepID=A0AAW2UUJ9_9LAMI